MFHCQSESPGAHQQERPGASPPDALSAILQLVRLKSVVWGRSNLSSPWGIRFPGGPDEFPPEHLAAFHAMSGFLPARPARPSGAFHVIIRGNCVLEADSVPGPLSLASGDLVMLLRGAAHTLRDSTCSRATPLWEAHPVDRLRQRQGMLMGGGGIPTMALHGVFFCESESGERLLSALPPILHLKARGGQLCPWLASVVRLLNIETSRDEPGARAIIDDLVQILFIRALRSHMSLSPSGLANWLQAVLDPHVGPSLGMIHRAPEATWTVASLADAVAASRSAFAARFTLLMGKPPLRYLTEYRMQKAAELLRAGHLPLKELASKVGYESEAAFSKAFKRIIGTPPGVYRRGMPEIVRGPVLSPATAG